MVSLIGDVVVETANQLGRLLSLMQREERCMAKENQSEFSLSLDRWQLLTTAAAAVTVAGIVPLSI